MPFQEPSWLRTSRGVAQKVLSDRANYHQIIFPIIQICLTIAAVTVAYHVYGVQQDAADRAKIDIDYRLVKLEEFNKQLEKQRALAHEQQAVVQ
jgi:hypothetical protein